MPVREDSTEKPPIEKNTDEILDDSGAPRARSFSVGGISDQLIDDINCRVSSPGNYRVAAKPCLIIRSVTTPTNSLRSLASDDRGFNIDFSNQNNHDADHDTLKKEINFRNNGINSRRFSSSPSSTSVSPMASVEQKRRHSYIDVIGKRLSLSRSPPPPINVQNVYNTAPFIRDQIGSSQFDQTEADEDEEDVNHGCPPPLAQAVVAALKHQNLLRSNTTNTSTASSRFSPIYLTEDSDDSDECSVDEQGSVNMDCEIHPFMTDKDSELNDDYPNEFDGESGYGASCSSSSSKLSIRSRKHSDRFDNQDKQHKVKNQYEENHNPIESIRCQDISSKRNTKHKRHTNRVRILETNDSSAATTNNNNNSISLTTNSCTTESDLNESMNQNHSDTNDGNLVCSNLNSSNLVETPVPNHHQNRLVDTNSLISSELSTCCFSLSNSLAFVPTSSILTSSHKNNNHNHESEVGLISSNAAATSSSSSLFNKPHQSSSSAATTTTLYARTSLPWCTYPIVPSNQYMSQNCQSHPDCVQPDHSEQHQFCAGENLSNPARMFHYHSESSKPSTSACSFEQETESSKTSHPFNSINCNTNSSISSAATTTNTTTTSSSSSNNNNGSNSDSNISTSNTIVDCPNGSVGTTMDQNQHNHNGSGGSECYEYHHYPGNNNNNQDYYTVQLNKSTSSQYHHHRHHHHHPPTIATNSQKHRCYSVDMLPYYEVNLTSLNNSQSSTSSMKNRVVSLIVDGVRFLLDIELLQAHPNTMLGRMFNSSNFLESTLVTDRDNNSGNDNNSRNKNAHHQDIYVAQHSNITAQLFRAILDYYLIGQIHCPPGVLVQELKEACDYFLIPFNHETIKCLNLRTFLHELTNDGARIRFEKFLEKYILSLLVKCTKLGERECHLVIVTNDELIEWDSNYPPQLPDNELNSHIIYNTQMFRFLKYVENRNVAKQVLLERGLKKIRIGIEGYPTIKDRVKFRPGLRPEAIYNYVQCPFLHMSWEEEENRSRHVDFQCVRSKSINDLSSGLEQAVIDPLPPHMNCIE